MSNYYKNLIKKRNKTVEEWKKLEEFCRKNNCMDIFIDLKDKQKFEEKNYLIKQNNFWDNLGVSTFSNVYTSEGGSALPFIYESLYYKLENKYVNLYNEKPDFICKDFPSEEEMDRININQLYYIKYIVLDACIRENVKTDRFVLRYDYENKVTHAYRVKKQK